VALPDEHTSMMDGLCHAILEDNGLKTTLKEVLNSERKNVIELVLALTEETIAVHAAQECLALEDTAGVLLVKGEELPCSIPDAAEGILHTPQLALAPQAILTNQLQLSIKALLLIRTPWLLESFTICIKQTLGELAGQTKQTHSRHQQKLQTFELCSKTANEQNIWVRSSTTKGF
jgi:hypothetical protein